MKHLETNTYIGPDDRIVALSPITSNQTKPKLIYTQKITPKSLKETFGDTGGWDLKCSQNCVSDCSCVSDLCYFLIA